MKPIIELEKNIELLINEKSKILKNWVLFDEVHNVLNEHHIEKTYFIEHFATAIFNYYVGVVKQEKAIGDCPVMAAFLDFLKEHDVSSAELFLICTHFRRSMLDALFDINIIDKKLFDEVSYVFDLNFSGVLDQYSGRIYSAQRETKVHKRRFEEYNLAVDHSAMVYKINLEGIITYANSRFSTISAYSNEELVGKSAQELQGSQEIESRADEIWKQLRRQDIFHGVVKNITKFGDTYYTETTIVPMLDHDGEILEYLAIAYDVSELIQTRDAALEAEKTKDQFLANMSHEIRTPLNAILGFVAVLRKRVEDAENSHYLDIINNSGESLLAIIGDILDFSKIKEGKLDIDEHIFNPTTELSHTLELFSSKMFEKNIQYLTYVDPFLPLNIKSDSIRIKQILSNFLSNALKFTPENGKVIVNIKYKEGSLIASVKDSGCGISKEAISRVFSAFEQAEGSTTRKFGGTGLGLSISQRLCEMMGGDIELESEINKGSIFRLVLPVESTEENNAYTPYDVYIEEQDSTHFHLLKRYLEKMKMTRVLDASPEAVNFYFYDSLAPRIEPYVLVSSKFIEDEDCLMPSFNAYKIMKAIEGEKREYKKHKANKVQYEGHVLIAEDNKANQMLMSLLLEEYGLTYVMTSDGKEAFLAFQKETFSMVLMDEQMPIMGGQEASENIIQYEIDNNIKHTPIISVTANALKGDKEKFLEAGMDGYIAKPIENVKLEEILNKFMPHEEIKMSFNLELPSYDNLSAEEMAAAIGLNVKHIPILVQSFTDESVSILENLEAAIESKNYEEISGFSHSIKGSSGNLKFTEMYELAKDMELSAKEGNTDYPYAQACANLKKAIQSISL